MKIIPAIDLKDGKCVRLFKGDFATAYEVAPSPFLAAECFIDAGASTIHIVDLDGAKDAAGKNRESIKAIAKRYPNRIQTGGGIRDMAAVEDLLAAGIKGVILGSAAVENKAFLKEAVKKYPDNIIVGIDAKDGFAATRGWVEISRVRATDLASEVASIGARTIIYTDISKDGTLSGPNVAEIKAIIDAAHIDVIASGGVSSILDLVSLKEAGASGAIVGKAIYSGDIDLKEAIDKIEKGAK